MSHNTPAQFAPGTCAQCGGMTVAMITMESTGEKKHTWIICSKCWIENERDDRKPPT